MSDEPRTPLGVTRTLLLYVGTAFAILQGADLLIDRLALPAWLFTATAVLLLLGLPVILATAYVQSRNTDGRTAMHAGKWLTWRNALVGGVVAFALLGVASVTQRMLAAVGGDDAAWARTTGLLDLARLTDEAKWDSAWALGARLQRVIPEDSTFKALQLRYATKVSLTTSPPDLALYRDFYAHRPERKFELVGTTPLDSVWVPRGVSRYRLQTADSVLAEFAASPAGMALRNPFTLDPGQPAGMVKVRGGDADLQTPGLDHIPAVKLGDYLLDRFEVTNREYKRFVDAGGYRTDKHWKVPFIRDGKPVAFADAMRLLVDRTGQPGPSTWEAGDYADNTGEHPVGGLSWYEAAAYADFAGKSLPTIYHWLRAAGTNAAQYVVPASNFAGKGTVAVGSTDAMSLYGNYDMAGNVREWCLNESNGQRYILGGGYSDHSYQFNDAYAQPVWDRSSINGVRLARYPDTANVAVAARRIELPFRDYWKEKPVADAEFGIYRRMYEYDRRALGEKVEAVDSTTSPYWIMQTVTFDAGYDSERMAAFVFLPRNGKPPYQTVVHFPGSNVIYLRSSKDIATRVNRLDFILKSGRAVIVPVFKGTFERGSGLKSDYQERTNFWREHVIAWVTEFRRTVDLVVERPDLDEHNVAYYGLSWGANIGGIIPALEPRVKAIVLYVGGLEMQETYPEVDPFNFLPRITQPVLMLNGRYDHFFPVETSQKPMFALLGTPAQDKRHVLYEGGHNVPHVDLIRETLAWLDRYLGPVR